MHKLIYIFASISGFLAVSIGAFGAHGLKTMLEKYGRLETFQTGVQYHFYHTMALFIVALMMHTMDSRYLPWAAWSFIAGIFIFSGSLYALSISNIGKLGAITPIGGLCFLVGWVFIGIAAIKHTW